MSDSAQTQIADYLKFFSSKTEVSVSEISASIDDVKEDSLGEAMFSRDEVEAILERVTSSVQDTANAELKRIVNMSALVLEDIFRHADSAITLNLTGTEDEVSLDRIGTMKFNTVPDVKDMKGRPIKLDSIRDEHQRLIDDEARLEQENAVLKEKAAAAQAQYTKAMREKAEMSAQIAELSSQLESARSALASAGNSSAAAEAQKSQEVAALEKIVSALRSELQEAQAAAASAAAETEEVIVERDAKTSETKQFRQLRAMLARKNTQLLEVRARLAKYEPDDTARMADDDDV